MSKELKINLFIGTPAYNSMVHTDYMHSLMSYSEAKLPFSVMTIGNESLITRGRNTIISYFNTAINYSHLLFLDADIYLSAADLIKLIVHEKDVIGAPVALKGYDADGKPVYNVGPITSENKEGLVTTTKVGTAVLLLSKKAVQALIDKAANDGDVYWPNPHTRGDSMPTIKMYDVFKTGVVEGDYLSEDYYVCKVLKELGFDIYVDTTVMTKHNGMYVFN